MADNTYSISAHHLNIVREHITTIQSILTNFSTVFENQNTTDSLINKDQSFDTIFSVYTGKVEQLLEHFFNLDQITQSNNADHTNVAPGYKIQAIPDKNYLEIVPASIGDAQVYNEERGYLQVRTEIPTEADADVIPSTLTLFPTVTKSGRTAITSGSVDTSDMLPISSHSTGVLPTITDINQLAIATQAKTIIADSVEFKYCGTPILYIWGSMYKILTDADIGTVASKHFIGHPISHENITLPIVDTTLDCVESLRWWLKISTECITILEGGNAAFIARVPGRCQTTCGVHYTVQDLQVPLNLPTLGNSSCLLKVGNEYFVGEGTLPGTPYNISMTRAKATGDRIAMLEFFLDCTEHSAPISHYGMVSGVVKNGAINGSEYMLRNNGLALGFAFTFRSMSSRHEYNKDRSRSTQQRNAPKLKLRDLQGVERKFPIVTFLGMECHDMSIGNEQIFQVHDNYSSVGYIGSVILGQGYVFTYGFISWLVSSFTTSAELKLRGDYDFHSLQRSLNMDNKYGDYIAKYEARVNSLRGAIFTNTVEYTPVSYQNTLMYQTLDSKAIYANVDYAYALYSHLSVIKNELRLPPHAITSRAISKCLRCEARYAIQLNCEHT